MEVSVVTERCSECGKEVEYESDRRYRTDLFFCSEECSRRFWKRDAEKRAELGWSPLRDENGNIAFPLEGGEGMEMSIIPVGLPERCDCGFENLKIHGTRIDEHVHIEVRCGRCGKVLWEMGK